jgi:hypothetical protein
MTVPRITAVSRGEGQWRRQSFWRPGANVIFVAPLGWNRIEPPSFGASPSGARGQLPPPPRLPPRAAFGDGDEDLKNTAVG